ncbi:hypothetical protein OB920_14330 [Halobacteria archaeon HArc-gm2]|nr:hypothetical protein [Halobacteria archaeon HArc-gm2]
MRENGSAERCQRVLAPCWALLLITSAISLAGAGAGAAARPQEVADETGVEPGFGAVAVDAAAASNRTVDGACVWENTAQGDYRTHFDVSCPTSTRQSGTVHFDMQGGWAYVVVVELPTGVDNATARVSLTGDGQTRMESPQTPEIVGDPELREAVADHLNRSSVETTPIPDEGGGQAEAITTHRGEAILRPVEVSGQKDGRPRAFRAQSEDFWNAELDLGRRDVAVVGEGYTNAGAGGGDDSVLVYPKKSMTATFELEPGVYDFEVRAYRPRVLSTNRYADAVQEKWHPVDDVEVSSGSFSVGVGDCTPRFAAQPKLEELSVRSDEAGADVERTQREHRQRGSGGGGGSAASRAAAAARARGADASGSTGGPMTAGLPNVSLKRAYEGPTDDPNDRQPDVEQKREDSAALNPLARTKRALEDRVTASQRLAGGSAPAGDGLDSVEREYAATMSEVRRCHGGGYVTVPPSTDDDEATYAADIDGRTATQAVAAALRERGLEPPQGSGLTMEDYVWTRVTQGSRGQTVTGTREAYVRVGPDGNVLPNPQTLARQRALGDVEAETLEGASHVLNVEMYRYPDGQHDATVRFVEVETGLIQNQRQGAGATGDAGLAEAVDDGLDQLQVDLAEPTDGRSTGKTIGLSDGEGSGSGGSNGGGGS